MKPASPGTVEPIPGTANQRIAAPQRYLWLLLAMLMSATVFEGYDITIFHLCTPDIARSFHLDDASIGAIAATVRFGGILSFFIVTLADRYGRKPIMSVTVLCYAFFTLLTALSSGMGTFTLFQSCSQIFLAAEFGVAITVISEEFPDAMRGRAISVMHMVAFIGVACAGLLYGVVANSSWGWRGMYFLGIIPLVLVALLRRGMRETARFSESERTRKVLGRARAPLLEPLRRCVEPSAGPYRSRLILVALLCNCIGVVGGPTISFFSLYAKRDHSWTSSQVGDAIVIAYLLGMCGTLLCGYLMDNIGRRATASMFFVGAGIAMVALFHSNSHQAILTGIMATMFTYQGARTATSALSAELFPTTARATGYSLTVQVFGQLGWMLAPLAAGLLSDYMGSLGNAAALFGVGPLIGAGLIMAYAPETKGRKLEELSPDLTVEHTDESAKR
ncbi:MAG: MFS transporter [Candidatus Binataceae bacterium]